MLALHHAAQVAADNDGLGIICAILLIGTIIAFILGVAEVLGLTSFGARAGVQGRFGGLIVAIILLVIYVVLC